MIESIHIVNRSSGISLFVKNFKEKPQSIKYPLNKEIIFVGFLKAIEDISEETRNQSVEEIILNESKIVFYKNKQLICVGITPKTDDSDVTRDVLKKIGDTFSEKYENELEFFSGRVSDFDNFSNILDTILKEEIGSTPTKIQYVKLNPLGFLKKMGIL